ncbi:MAG: gas vesicle protein GvpD P-loop domain-containing protein [Methanobacteriota archaeon]
MKGLASDSASIPREIADFFNKPGGRSLIVKGAPGTGKTTFALQLLEELGKPNKSFYLSTRVSDEALYNQFPWLRDTDMKNRIVDSSRMLLEALCPVGSDEEEIVESKKITATRVKAAKGFLKSISSGEMAPPSKVDRTRLKVITERIRMPEIERIYDCIERALPDKSILIVDSIEGVTHKYGIDMDEFINCLQKDLVEGSNTDVLLVLEKADAPSLEYLVDGVISLTSELYNERRVRHMKLAKLRATEIRQPSYLLSLKGGRFTGFNSFVPNHLKAGTWQVVADPAGHYSTGIADLDALLGGGYAVGSYNVLEVDENVSSEEYYMVVRPILLNFMSQQKGIVAVLTGGDHADAMRKDLTRFIPAEQFDKYVRIADYFQQRTDMPYVMALARPKEEAFKIWKQNLEHLRGAEGRPIIDYAGFDTLEYLQGGEVAIRNLFDAVAKIKISKDMGIGILKPGLKLRQEILNMADTFIRISSIDKRPCIYGVKPKTIIHAMVSDEEKGPPYVKLVPIV